MYPKSRLMKVVVMSLAVALIPGVTWGLIQSPTHGSSVPSNYDITVSGWVDPPLWGMTGRIDATNNQGALLSWTNMKTNATNGVFEDPASVYSPKLPKPPAGWPTGGTFIQINATIGTTNVGFTQVICYS